MHVCIYVCKHILVPACMLSGKPTLQWAYKRQSSPLLWLFFQGLVVDQIDFPTVVCAIRQYFSKWWRYWVTVTLCFPKITQEMKVPWCWLSDVGAEGQCGGPWDAACRAGSGTAGLCNAAQCSLGLGQQPAAYCSHHSVVPARSLCACCVCMHNYVCEQVLLAQSLLLCCIWFPFSSLQILSATNLLEFCFNSCCVVTQLWLLPGLLVLLSSPISEDSLKAVGLSILPVPCVQEPWGARWPQPAQCCAAELLLALLRICGRSGGPERGSWTASTQLNNKMMSLLANQEGWCHMPGSPRVRTTRGAAPALLLSLCHHQELLGTEPFEVYYLRVKCAWNTIHQSCSSWDWEVSQGCRTVWELLQLVNEAREEQANGSVRTVLTVLVVQPCVLSKVCVGVWLLLLMCMINHSCLLRF